MCFDLQKACPPAGDARSVFSGHYLNTSVPLMMTTNDIMTRSMTKELEQATRSGLKRISPSPIKTTPIKKLFRYNCPVQMCLNCQTRLQQKDCDCHLTFEYQPSEETRLLKLAIVAEQEHLDELERLRARRQALEQELEMATRNWSTDFD